MARIPPTPSTTKQLFALSGNNCSNPSCNNLLVKNNVVLGEICHIEGAEENSPRFNGNSNDEYRRSFQNLILLCESCHKIIDTKIKDYPVELINDWKKLHEELNKSRKLKIDNNFAHKFINSSFNNNSNSGIINQIKNTGKNQQISVTNIINNYNNTDKSLYNINLDAKFNELKESFNNHLFKDVIKISKSILSEFSENLNPKLFYSIYIIRSKSFMNTSFFGKTEYYIKRALVSLKQAERINNEYNLENENKYKLQLANAHINLSYIRLAEENLDKVKLLLDEIFLDNEIKHDSEFYFIKGKYFLSKAENTADIGNNVLNAIDSLQLALKEWTEENHPFRNALCKINMGNAYSLLSRVKNRTYNFQKAFLYFQEAITFFSIEKSAFYHSLIQLNMGYAYSFISESNDNYENLINARKCLEIAKKINADSERSIHFAKANLILCNTYNFLAQNTLKENYCKESIDAGIMALSVYKPADFPKLNATVYANIGSSYWILSEIEYSRAQKEKKEGNKAKTDLHLEKSKDYILHGFTEMKIALNVYKNDNYPVDYGKIMNNMGLLYRGLAKHENEIKNLKKAINYYRMCTEINTKISHPVDFIRALINLGNAQKELALFSNNKAIHIDVAIKTYNEAKDFYEEEKSEIGYGMVAHNMGEAYRYKHSFTKKCRDLYEALRLQRESLEIFNKEKYGDAHNTICNEIENVQNIIKENNCD